MRPKLFLAHMCLTNLLHGTEPFLRSYQLRSYSIISQHFIEPRFALPCSQEPSTNPIPGPDESRPYHPILYLLRSILILSSHLRLGIPSGLIPSGFPTKPRSFVTLRNKIIFTVNC
jgi:hypothetical protein